MIALSVADLVARLQASILQGYKVSQRVTDGGPVHDGTRYALITLHRGRDGATAEIEMDLDK